MGIDVYWKSESGEILDSVIDSGALEQMSALLARQTQSTCLKFIDPAGDACFNQLQLPDLETELRYILGSVEIPRWRTHLQAILALVDGAHRTHTYVWFAGD